MYLQNERVNAMLVLPFQIITRKKTCSQALYTSPPFPDLCRKRVVLGVMKNVYVCCKCLKFSYFFILSFFADTLMFQTELEYLKKCWCCSAATMF